jgi:hypothetical protein
MKIPLPTIGKQFVVFIYVTTITSLSIFSQDNSHKKVEQINKAITRMGSTNTHSFDEGWHFTRFGI